MLSICIPVYNYNITQLVSGLWEQAEQAGISYEILLIDDGSASCKEENRKISALKNVVYKELEHNTGRSAIRNLLAKEAKYPYLIFMDCDAQIYSSAYISKYIECCKKKIVCYGGRKHAENCPGKEYLLRWKYGRTREDAPASKRSQRANDSFITFNFLIDKDIFQSIKFEEKLKSYGHEDTLFGIELKHLGITVKHIDNPLYHIGLETSESFIKQTESSIRNLVKIQEEINSSEEFRNSSKLLRTYTIISKLHLVKMLARLFGISKTYLLKNLLGENPNLFLFDLYKLGYLCTLQ